jgi:hypothetical protein
MPHEIAVRDVKIGDYILSVTTRASGDDRPILEELTYRTVMTWYNIVTNRLEKENYFFEGGSVEDVYADDLNKNAKADTDAPKQAPFEFKETFGDSRVTVWDTYRGAKHPCFHLNSDDSPQGAIATWRANQIGTERAVAKLEAAMPKTAPKVIQDDHQQAQQQFDNLPSTNVSQTPQNANPPVAGAIVATRAPNPTVQEYADGQLVEFKINKIVLGTHPSGSVIYSLWGDLGKRYALKTVYVMASNGTDKSYDYQTAAPVLESLALSIPGKVQAEGNWKLVCKATNSGAKQYLNIVSLS